MAWAGAGLGYGSNAPVGEGAQKRPKGGDGGCYDADVDFDVGPDAGGDIDPCFGVSGEGGREDGEGKDLQVTSSIPSWRRAVRRMMETTNTLGFGCECFSASAHIEGALEGWLAILQERRRTSRQSSAGASRASPICTGGAWSKARNQ